VSTFSGISSSDYEITIYSVHVGKEVGSIQFVTEDGEYVWFPITVKTTESDISDIFSITTQPRMPAVVQILLQNTSNTDVLTYNVKIKGLEYLNGPSVV
jgi:hypothetical protein